ncbi:MAG: DUF86 domain-containing protein [Patescibacteria group bacterium]
MKDYQILIDHILESIEWIENYTKDISKDDFLASVQIQDSVIRRLEIIGEAVGNFPEEIEKKYPDVKWREISGMRNFLIHEYFGVSISLVWNAVKKDIPVLKEQMKKLKK